MSDVRQFPPEEGVNISPQANTPPEDTDRPSVRVDIQIPVDPEPPGYGHPPEDLTPPVDGGYTKIASTSFSLKEMQLTEFLNANLIGVNWNYWRMGGNGSFICVLSKRFDDGCTWVAEDARLGIWVFLPSVGEWRLWYKGVVERVRFKRQGSETFSIIEGTGCMVYLNRVIVARSYSYMTVRDIVTDIIDGLVRPQTRIQVDTSKITAGDYVVKNFNPQTTALKAIKMLADLEGDVEWGVDENATFYFMPKQTEVGSDEVFLINNDLVNVEELCWFDTKNHNKLRMEGEDFQTHIATDTEEDENGTGDDVGIREAYQQAAALGHTDDLARLGINLINLRRSTEDGAVFSQNENQYIEMDQYYPMPRFRVHDPDNENYINYDFTKVDWSCGGKTQTIVKTMWDGGLIDVGGHFGLKARWHMGRFGRSIVDEFAENEAVIDNLRMRDAQRKDNKLSVGLLPTGPVFGTHPMEPHDAVIGIHSVKNFMAAYDLSLGYRGGTGAIATARGLEMKITLKYAVTATPADFIELYIHFLFYEDGDLMTESTSRRVILSGDDLPSAVNTMKIKDLVFILNGEFKANADMVVVVERKGETSLRDSFGDDFCLSEVRATLVKQGHPPRVNVGRANVSRCPADEETL